MDLPPSSLNLYASDPFFFIFLFAHVGHITSHSDSSAAFYGLSPQLSFYLVAIANASSSIGEKNKNTKMLLNCTL